MSGSPLWRLRPGQQVRRRDLHAEFGGNRQGGISPSAAHAEIFVFAGESGREHGYVDRIGEDGLFHYTGQGQQGDQALSRANQALLEHRRLAKAVRVFLGVSGVVTYVGEFELDERTPYYWTEAPSTGGGPLRSVLVFRLRPLPGAKLGLLANVYAEPVVPSEEWNRHEIDNAVLTYADLLQNEIDGAVYDDRDLLRALQPQLPGRSEESIRRVLRNISAVLDEAGSDWIEGYDPASGYQADLRASVQRLLGPGKRIAESLAAFEDAAIAPPGSHMLSFDDVVVPAPSGRAASSGRSKVRLVGGQVSAMKDFKKRQLGKAGEEWVLRFERRQLEQRGRPDLAARVRWTAELDGDGAGYDIRSYWSDGRERCIEVKTTNLGIGTPFYITGWEVDVSTQQPESYSLYRLHGFNRDPRIYILDGSVEETAQLEPKVFVGFPR